MTTPTPMPPQLALAASSNSRRSQRSRCLRLRAVPDKTLTGSQIPKSSRAAETWEGKGKRKSKRKRLDWTCLSRRVVALHLQWLPQTVAISFHLRSFNCLKMRKNYPGCPPPPSLCGQSKQIKRNELVMRTARVGKQLASTHSQHSPAALTLRSPSHSFVAANK